MTNDEAEAVVAALEVGFDLGVAACEALEGGAVYADVVTNPFRRPSTVIVEPDKDKRLALAVEKAAALTPEEVFAISVRAGIHNPDGSLTTKYGGDLITQIERVEADAAANALAHEHDAAVFALEAEREAHGVTREKLANLETMFGKLATQCIEAQDAETRLESELAEAKDDSGSAKRALDSMSLAANVCANQRDAALERVRVLEGELAKANEANIAVSRIVRRSLACGQLEKLDDARPYLTNAEPWPPSRTAPSAQPVPLAEGVRVNHHGRHGVIVALPSKRVPNGVSNCDVLFDDGATGECWLSSLSPAPTSSPSEDNREPLAEKWCGQCRDTFFVYELEESCPKHPESPKPAAEPIPGEPEAPRAVMVGSVWMRRGTKFTDTVTRYDQRLVYLNRDTIWAEEGFRLAHDHVSDPVTTTGEGLGT